MRRRLNPHPFPCLNQAPSSRLLVYLHLQILLISFFPSAVGKRKGDANAGYCCYLCDNNDPPECYGCWSPDALCGQSPVECAETCSGTWKPGVKPHIVELPASASDDPHALPAPPVSWHTVPQSLTRLPGSPLIVGDFIYLTPGGLVLGNETSSWIEKRGLENHTLLWHQHVPVSPPQEELPPEDEPPPYLPTSSYVHYTLKPVVAEDRVYVQVDNFDVSPMLSSFSIESGDFIWSTNETLRPIPTPVAAGGGLVYFLNARGDLIALNKENGKTSWHFSARNPTLGVTDLSPPAFVGGNVFMTDVTNPTNPSDQRRYYFVAIDPSSGYPSFDVTCRTSGVPWMSRAAAKDELVLVVTTTFDGVSDLPFPLGAPQGSLTAITPKGGHTSYWPEPLTMQATIGEPALADVNSETMAIFTACSDSPLAHTPPLWWIGCVVWGINAHAMGEHSYSAVSWRWAPEEDVALSHPRVAGGVVFLSGVYFINGSWPDCVWPPTEPLPNCTLRGNQTLPGYENPFIVALDAAKGTYLWRWNISGDSSEGRRLRTWAEFVSVSERLAMSGGIKLTEGESEEEFTNLLYAHAAVRKMGGLNVLTSVPELAPWESFDVNEDGTRLVYTSYDEPRGLFCLDVSARLPSSNNNGSSVSPWSMVLVCCGGVLVAGSLALYVYKTCYNNLEEKVGLLDAVDGVLSPKGKKTAAFGGVFGLSVAGGPEEQRGYTIIKQLGRGGFGSVFLVKCKSNGQLFSLKRIDCRNNRELRIAKREVSILSNLPEHPGLMKIVASFVETTSVFMVLPYYEQGDLAAYIAKYPDPVIPESIVVSFGRQLAEVLVHLHGQSPPVVHRDLKPENILLTSDCQHIVVGDFGLSRLVDKTYMHTHAGTMAFMAPEAFDGPYDTKIDLWSFGCVIYSMCLKRARNCRVMCVHVGRKGFHQEIADSISAQGYSPLVVDLVRQTLQASRHARPSAEEVLFRLGEEAPPSLRLGTSHSSAHTSRSDTHDPSTYDQLLQVPQDTSRKAYSGQQHAAGSNGELSAAGPQAFNVDSRYDSNEGEEEQEQEEDRPYNEEEERPQHSARTVMATPPGLLKGIVPGTANPPVLMSLQVADDQSAGSEDETWMPPPFNPAL